MKILLEQLDYAGSLFAEFALPMLVQSAVIILALFAVDFALRRRIRASVRHLLWLLVPVQLVLPPFLPMPEKLNALLSARAAYFAGTVGASGSQAIMLPATALTWRAILVAVWLFVAGSMTLCWVRRALRSRRIALRAREGNSLMRGVLWYCRTCMGVRERVQLKLSSETTRPIVCGLVRPMILVPHNLASSLGSRHLRCVLLHELAYVKRLDIWVEFAQKLLQVIYFYNPLLWAANYVIRRTRDEAVDEMVVAVMGDKAQWYRQTRINVSNLAREKPAGQLKTMSGTSTKRAPNPPVRHTKTREFAESGNYVACVIIAAVIMVSF
jgi:bla regulator protein BlaR1